METIFFVFVLIFMLVGFLMIVFPGKCADVMRFGFKWNPLFSNFTLFEKKPVVIALGIWFFLGSFGMLYLLSLAP